jgi:hypothetical protein
VDQVVAGDIQGLEFLALGLVDKVMLVEILQVVDILQVVVAPAL